MKILTDGRMRRSIQYKWRWRGKSYQSNVFFDSQLLFYFSFIERGQSDLPVDLSSVSEDPYSEAATAAYGG